MIFIFFLGGVIKEEFFGVDEAFEGGGVNGSVSWVWKDILSGRRFLLLVGCVVIPWGGYRIVDCVYKVCWMLIGVPCDFGWIILGFWGYL